MTTSSIAAPSYLTSYTNTMTGFSSQSQGFVLDATSTTPLIKYSKSHNSLVVRGNSTSTNMEDFYKPIMAMLKNDALTSRSVTVDMSLITMNMPTLKVLFDLFKYLELKKLTGGNVEVIWRVDATNPEMIDTGLNFSDLYDLDIKVLTK